MFRRLARKRLHLPRLDPYLPGADDPRTFWLDTERDDLVAEVVRRLLTRHGGDDEPLEGILSDAAYHEVQRLEAQRDEEAGARLPGWREVVRRLGGMSYERKHQTLEEIVRRMAYDVAGNFDPRVYRFAAKVVPSVLAGVMQPASVLPGSGEPPDVRLERLVATEGDTERLRELSKIATLLFVPTHSSNMDSLAVAWVLHREGLPPAVYGAGKNLFTNPIISFFMHNLGAYRVDRRIRAQLYKDVLKTYSTVLIERGYHSLFFPGGTRSRSGEVEQHLKLGLAGTGVEAFARNAVRGNPRPVLFVPVTINYTLVLEAETLISDFLHEQGRARYIIDDDEFSRLDRWVTFFHRLRGQEGACIIRFGAPIDPFGNPVDDEGRSLSPAGEPIDPVTYLWRQGTPTVDPARDHAYTESLGHEIADAYLRETVIMPTQAVAHALYRRLVAATLRLDPFARLRRKGELAVPRRELAAEVGALRDALVELEGEDRVRVSPWLRRADPQAVIDQVLAVWSGYHLRPVASERPGGDGGSVVAEDPRLLLFYGNRLRPYALDVAGADHQEAARHIAREVWRA